MKIVVVPALIFALSVVSEPAAETHEMYLPEDPLAGANLFSAMGCQSCHAVEGRVPAFVRNLEGSNSGHSLLDILGLMLSHSPQVRRDMATLKLNGTAFTGHELAALGAYVYVRAYFDKPGDVDAGKTFFINKSCRRCHQVAGIGKDIGPDLAGVKAHVPPVLLGRMIWSHGPGIQSCMYDQGVLWPTFKGGDLADLTAFLMDASDSDDSDGMLPSAGSPKVGRQLFQDKQCTACHRVFGTGQAAGPDLTRSTFYWDANSLADVMWNHEPETLERMDQLGIQNSELEERELVDLTAFLYFLQFTESPADLSRGRSLFEQKSCVSCHHLGAEEVEGSRSLAGFESQVSVLEVAARMWTHSKTMSQATEQKGIPWFEFKPGEMNDLLAYIVSRNN